jgi:hypothetical protein
MKILPIFSYYLYVVIYQALSLSLKCVVNIEEVNVPSAYFFDIHNTSFGVQCFCFYSSIIWFNYLQVLNIF